MLDEPFRGDEADLFAAAMVLFQMRQRSCPFINAKADHTFYAFFCNNKANDYWEEMGPFFN